MVKAISGIIGALFSTIIARGILLWLTSKEIYPEKWVARMIGYSESAEAVFWILLGLSGFVGLFLGPAIWEAGLRVKRRFSDDQPALKQPGSEYDVWLLDAINYVAFGRWERPMDLDLAQRLGKLPGAVNEVRQKACDGELVIYGTTGFASTPLLPIPKEYWINYGVDFLEVAGNNAKELTTKSTGTRTGDGVRRNLKTSRRKVEEIWG